MVEEFKKEKMDRLDVNANENQSGKEDPQDSKDPEDGVTESKACPDLHKDLADLTSQVQMMSDSLAACKQMSKYRPLRKAYDVAGEATPRTSSQALPPAQKTARCSAWERDMVVSYATSRSKSVKQQWTGSVCHRGWNVPSGWGQDAGQLGFVSHPEDLQRQRERDVGSEKDDEKETERLAELIQRELQELVSLAPKVSVLANVLADTLLRYLRCRKCSKRISSSLPWILNRIQELIAYVGAKRKQQSSDGCLQLNSKGVQTSVEELLLQEQGTELAKSKKVDAREAAEGGTPGVQFLLQVAPEDKKKRLLQKVGQKPPDTQPTHCIVVLKEPSAVPVVHVVKPSREPQVHGEAKRQVIHLREYSLRFRLLLLSDTRIPVSIIVLTAELKAATFRKARKTLNLKEVAPFEERTLQWQKNSVTLLTRKTPSPRKRSSRHSLEGESGVSFRSGKDIATPEERSTDLSVSRGQTSRRGSDERKSFGLGKFLANAPDLVKELLREAEEEKMEARKLEPDVNCLKDLMLEVHRNQIELSRFLLENGIYSQPIIKLTNPHMLEEESVAIKELENCVAGYGTRSVQSLQAELRVLKERCVLKKKMIMCLVKGLQSGVPHEWWEEMMNFPLDESKPTEEFDFERFTQLYGNISLYLAKAEQESKKKTRAEQQPPEVGSDSEIPGLSDSDRESDYLTGQEDFKDERPLPVPEEDVDKRTSFGFITDASETSSFVQNILYEDSRAGVAVVDLFVTVKKVKDSLDFLSRCNNEVFSRIDDLTRDAGLLRKQYGDFVGNLKSFLSKMNADSHIWDVLARKWKRRNLTNLTNTRPSEGGMYLQSVPYDSDECAAVGKCAEEMQGQEPPETDIAQKEEEEEERRKLEEENTCNGEKEGSLPECSECGRTDRSTAENKKCLGCFLQTFRDSSLERQPVLSEAFLGSFLASLLWLQNGRESSVSSSKTSSRAGSVILEEKEKSADRKLAVRMISDIREIVGGARWYPKEPSLRTTEDTDLELSSKPSFASMSEPPDYSGNANTKPTAEAPQKEELSCLYRGEISSPKDSPKWRRSRESFRTTKEELTSEEDSDFEEASCVPLVPARRLDLRAKPSVTCMGDLTKEVAPKRSACAFTSAINVVPSWIEKLSNEIISKLRKRKSKTGVRIFQKPYEKPKKGRRGVEFTMAANTPVGVFDVTVVQHKKSRLIRDGLVQLKSYPVQSSFVSSPTGRDLQLSGGLINPKEDSWSDDSLRNMESDVVSNSGESDFEEFIEIFLDNPRGNRNNGKGITASGKTGILKRLELKTCKPKFFEIQKCHPVDFVQEILQKPSSAEQQLMVENYRNQINEQTFLNLNSGEKKQKEVVIKGSTSDLVIYIQVEVEGNPASTPDGVYLEYQKSSLGTQTAGSKPGDERPAPSNGETTIKLESGKQDGMSLYQIWKGCFKSSSTDSTALMPSEKEPGAGEEDLGDDVDEEVLMVQGPKEKTVTFNEELSEVFIEREIRSPRVEIHARGIMELRDTKQHADVWFPQQNHQWVERTEIRTALPPMIAVDTVPEELQKALTLIREIESDVVDVKLSDAISILPRLETELRKHLQEKLRGLGERDSKGSSLQNFFSAIDFWPEEEPAENASESSEDRLNNLLSMLADLEEAVKSSECTPKDMDTCQCDSSKIHRLLRELTTSIRELEGQPNIMSLSQILEIASQLDTAVREYDSIVRREPVDYVSSEGSAGRNWKAESRSAAEVSVMQHLKNVRKKVFLMVEEEAIAVEGRVERDFDRLDRLEGQNDEVLMFLETFLQKTERRVTELADLKVELKGLSSSLYQMYEDLKEMADRKREKEMEIVQIKGPKDPSLLTESSVDFFCVPAPEAKSEPIRETISGLLIALDTLKTKAKKKKELCKEILFAGNAEKMQGFENSSQRSSRSSFTTKHGDKLWTTLKEFKKIGETSLYLAWTKPEGPLMGSIVGYQIHVNNRLNQKVRNPERLQAVLYSVDLTTKADVQLFALTGNGQKILLATISYQDE